MNANENKTPEATPDQLMKMLDLQLASMRQKRKKTAGSRAALMVGAILLILGGCAFAFFILLQMTSDLRRPERSPAALEAPYSPN